MFDSIDEYRAQARALGAEAFAVKHPQPFLLYLGRAPSASTAPPPGTPAAPGAPRAARRTPPTGLCPPLSPRRVLVVRKRVVNVYESIITVGRAQNNDIVLESFETVSRFHAFFSHAEGAGPDAGWSIGDGNSSHGTLADQARLPPNRATVPVRSGCELRFGPDALFVFLSPRDFADRALWG